MYLFIPLVAKAHVHVSLLVVKVSTCQITPRHPHKHGALAHIHIIFWLGLHALITTRKEETSKNEKEDENKWKWMQ